MYPARRPEPVQERYPRYEENRVPPTFYPERRPEEDYESDDGDSGDCIIEVSVSSEGKEIHIYI